MWPKSRSGDADKERPLEGGSGIVVVGVEVRCADGSGSVSAADGRSGGRPGSRRQGTGRDRAGDKRGGRVYVSVRFPTSRKALRSAVNSAGDIWLTKRVSATRSEERR